MAEAHKKPQGNKTKPGGQKTKPAPMAGKKQFRRPRPMRKRGKRPDRPAQEFEQKIVDLARVTRVMAGGKRMKFRACMVIGDKKGRVAIGIAKGVDVAMAISKSVTKAKKGLINVPIVDGTIPHQVEIKFKAAKLLIKPGKKGSGIKAGGVLRIVLELAGVKDVVAKILGTNNKVNNAKAAIMALSSFVTEAESTKKVKDPEQSRGETPKVAKAEEKPKAEGLEPSRKDKVSKK